MFSIHPFRTSLALLGVAFAATAVAWGQESVANEQTVTLVLGSASFVSFQNEANQGIPAGGRVRFHLGVRGADGSIPFTLNPGDVQIPAFPIGQSAQGKYELVAPTSGAMRRGANGLEMSFPARIRATTIPAEGARVSLEYDLVFTTAKATASSSDRAKSVAPQGKAVNENDGTVELVVATTNRMDAGPIPGAATFAYLVGKFDVVPGKVAPKTTR